MHNDIVSFLRRRRRLSDCTRYHNMRCVRLQFDVADLDPLLTNANCTFEKNLAHLFRS